MDEDRIVIDRLPQRALPAYSHERATVPRLSPRTGTRTTPVEWSTTPTDASLFSADSNYTGYGHGHGSEHPTKLRSHAVAAGEAGSRSDGGTSTICPRPRPHTKGAVEEAASVSSLPNCDLSPSSSNPLTAPLLPRLTPEEEVALSALPLLSREQYTPDIGHPSEQYGRGLRTDNRLSRHPDAHRDSPADASACLSENENNNIPAQQSTIVPSTHRHRPPPVPIPSLTSTPRPSARSSNHSHSHGYEPYPARPVHSNKSSSAARSCFDLGSAHDLLSAPASITSRPSWLNMSSTTVDVPRTPLIAKTPATPGSSGGSSRINSPGMSLARKRRAPAWPSPRTDLPTRDLSTMYTPAALKVPPTADLSPAFHRSGYAAPPKLKSLKSPAMVSASAPMPSPAKLPAAGMVPTGRVKVSGIPQGYVVTQLNALAEKFWFDPKSADCTVLIPVPRKASSPQGPPDSAVSVHSNQPGHSYWPPTPIAPDLQDVVAAAGPARTGDNVISSHRVTRGRRGSLPDDQAVPVLVFPLHKDYLITQSSLFRSLLSASPLGHLNLPSTPRRNSSHARSQSTTDPRGALTGGLGGPGSFAASQRALLARKGARVLPQKQGEGATVFVPVPDPGSFGVIVHWLYWGNVSALESALNKGLVTWQGVVKNIEYLGLDDNVKKVMGKWWRKWVKTEGGRRVSEGDAPGRRKPGWKRKTAGDGGLGAWDDESDDDGDRESVFEREISPLPGRAVDPADDEVSGLLRAL